MSDAEFVAGLQRKYDMLEADVENLYRLIISKQNRMGLAGVPFENETVQNIWNEVRSFVEVAIATESTLNRGEAMRIIDPDAEKFLTVTEDCFPRLCLKGGVLRKDFDGVCLIMNPEEGPIKKDSGEEG